MPALEIATVDSNNTVCNSCGRVVASSPIISTISVSGSQVVTTLLTDQVGFTAMPASGYQFVKYITRFEGSFTTNPFTLRITQTDDFVHAVFQQSVPSVTSIQVGIAGRNLTTGIGSTTSIDAHDGDTIEIFGVITQNGQPITNTCVDCVGIIDVTVQPTLVGKVGLGSLGPGNYLFHIVVPQGTSSVQPQPRHIVASYNPTSTSSAVFLVNFLPTTQPPPTCIQTAITSFTASNSNIQAGGIVQLSGKLVRTDTNAGIGAKTVVIVINNQNADTPTTSSDGSFTSSIGFKIPNTYTIVAQFNGDTGCQ